jgi:prepilin-type N-terminal cleavage/methylation domain-containing protein
LKSGTAILFFLLKGGTLMNDNSQGGFTLLETLIAMGVVSLIMIILALSLSSSAGTMEKAKDRVLFGIQLLRADSLVRNRIGAVAVPYWETPVLETEESSLRIPWYQGERESFVRLLVEEGTLVMETAGKEKKERILLVSDLDGAEFSVLRNSESIPYGVGVACFRGQNSYQTLSAFATLPVTGLASAGGLPSTGGLPSVGGRP